MASSATCSLTPILCYHACSLCSKLFTDRWGGIAKLRVASILSSITQITDIAIMSKTLLPNVQWAQRSDRVYLTIDLQDTADSKPEISLSNDAEGKHGHLSFKGKGQSHATGSDAHNYALELDLYGPINVEESKVRVTGRGIVLVIEKQEKSGQYSQGQRLHAHV